MQLAAFLSLAAELSHMRHLHPSPASEASAGRCIGDLRSPFLSKQDADALHRLCAKQRSGGGGRFVENLLTRELFLKTPTLAFALLRPSLPARGRDKKGPRRDDAGISSAVGHSRLAPCFLQPRRRRLRRDLRRPEWRYRLSG